MNEITNPSSSNVGPGDRFSPCDQEHNKAPNSDLSVERDAEKTPVEPPNCNIPKIEHTDGEAQTFVKENSTQPNSISSSVSEHSNDENKAQSDRNPAQEPEHLSGEYIAAVAAVTSGDQNVQETTVLNIDSPNPEDLSDGSVSEPTSPSSYDNENPEPEIPQMKDALKNERHEKCQFQSDKLWLDRQYNDDKSIKQPHQLETTMNAPDASLDQTIVEQIRGSIIGMAIGDALGAHVEFRPHSFLISKPVTDLVGGGTWGLKKGQFTDDTSMALCLANSLIARGDFVLYDQLVRYTWWFKDGYMSSTGHCFDIGAATSQSLMEFAYRQKELANKTKIPLKDLDYLSDSDLLEKIDVYCSEEGVAGNGALMRLAPVPLFFFRHPEIGVEYSGRSGQITHGDVQAYDACRYYGALIIAALRGYTKEQILDNEFYAKHKHWFGNKKLHSSIQSIAEGSYKKGGGYDEGIRGKGFIVKALEAALWAFWSDEDSFMKGALKAVNLGDDTDTTAAIYGQLAGAYYGYQKLPNTWLEHVYAKEFMTHISQWLLYQGDCWYKQMEDFISRAPFNSL